MAREDKQLLLIDLSARLPYGVKVWYKYYSENVTEKFATSIRLVDGKIALSSKFNREGDWYPVEEANELLIKPYLRSMSSMTEDEKKMFKKLHEEIFMGSMPYISASTSFYDWLNAHHFDYRGLIPMGLALEAPEGMYNQNYKNMHYNYFPSEFSSYEDYVKYLKEKGLAIEVTEKKK